MKSLVVEDDFTSRLLLQKLLKPYGPSHLAVNGREAVEIVGEALRAQEPYDLICLDIMMPEMDGKEALRQIRSLERACGIVPSNAAKIVMTTALADEKSIKEAMLGQCDHYLLKPIRKEKLIEELRYLRLIGKEKLIEELRTLRVIAGQHPERAGGRRGRESG